MIRGTTNEGISSATKQVADPTNNPGIAGESIEHVATTANPGGEEKKDSEARVAGQTTTPSDGFNGTFE